MEPYISWSALEIRKNIPYQCNYCYTGSATPRSDRRSDLQSSDDGFPFAAMVLARMAGSSLLRALRGADEDTQYTRPVKAALRTA
jgi:hypothetical protein